MTDDLRLYVIGDIHGRSDLLDRMVERIASDLAMNPAENTVTVTLGDYIDRGPDSRGVIERLARNPFPTRYVALKGNHEEVLGTFLGDDPSVMERWRRFGALETLHSYGVPVADIMMSRGYDVAAQALQAALPEAHAGFLASLQTSASFGDYFLCHAGVKPGVPLQAQRPEDLLWIRDEFLLSDVPFGKVVVHGHTPAEEPEVRSNRINVDTGAFMTGRLTCVVLQGGRHRFLSATTAD